MGKAETLPGEVMEWAGLREGNGDAVYIGRRVEQLSVHNDSCRTFVEIAEAIQMQL